MRYPASEKLEIIRIVEQSHLPAKRTLDQLGVARRTFYRWYDRYLEGGPEALQDRPSAPSRVWNRIGEDIQSRTRLLLHVDNGNNGKAYPGQKQRAAQAQGKKPGHALLQRQIRAREH